MRGKRGKFELIDTEFSRLVKMRAGYRCEVCGGQFLSKDRRLQCHHYIRRRNKATRWYLDNCVSICAGCHIKVHDSPHDEYHWMVKHLGNERYERLIRQKNTIVKATKDYKVKRLAEIRLELEEVKEKTWQ